MVRSSASATRINARVGRDGFMLGSQAINEKGSLTADIVLEGGGVKGTALVGAVAALEEAGYRFNRVAGTSAGSLVAAMVAAGIPAAQLHERMLALDFTRFRDPMPLKRLHLSGLGVALGELREGGVYRGDAMR